jgi:type VI secretion system secreted protein Hcp
MHPRERTMPIYMKVDGIDGAVKGKYKGLIELQSCQFGTHRNITAPTGRGSERRAAPPSVSEIVVTKEQDTTSTALFRESLTGSGKKVVIEFVKGDPPTPYMRVALDDVLISSFSVSGHGGGNSAKPLESLSLNFSRVKYETTAN